MNSSASGSQRTGQPMWVQLTENAINSSALSRRNHAALFAVMPAHGSGEGSAIGTSTVFPISKSSTLPTGIHSSGTLRNNGATTNPTIGTAIIIVHNPAQAIESPETKVRRDISSGVG